MERCSNSVASLHLVDASFSTGDQKIPNEPLIIFIIIITIFFDIIGNGDLWWWICISGMLVVGKGIEDGGFVVVVAILRRILFTSFAC